MKYFQASTESFIKSEKTKLAADALSGTAVSLTVDNSDGFSNNDFVIVGNEGDDKAEVSQINASISSDTSIQVDELKFDHDKDEPITKIRFDQRKLYGATEKGGSYSVVGSPKNIEVDNPQGTYFEYTGTTYDYFKCTYYNSETTEETSLSDAKAVHAVDEAVYATVDDIRIKAGFEDNPYLTDGMIADVRDKTQSYIEGKLKKVYDLPLSEVPEVLEDICVQLSAARLMDMVLSGTSEKADEMKKEAKSMLMEVIDGDIDLVGSNGNKMDSSGTTNLKGYPDGSDDDGFDDMFSMDMEF